MVASAAGEKEVAAAGEMEAAAEAAAGASSAVGLQKDLRLRPHLAVPWFVGQLLVLGYPCSTSGP